ncbi:hypothetical protein D3H65_06465 [Paraflavitalea soli]|uniref:Uncharacterized protein n=1 Tax=Paraflavitalea soli TaxID=2315862 RepID=A0A3B7MK16_9BACT|nr:hypothetical protein [Paraflavitalea soli]AXY73643.1 hypothetical protein D3H65_06465 [Paraflavitalea soli]
MIAKFKVEGVITVKDKVYVLTKFINTDINFILTDNSYLGLVPIERWMDIPRAHDEEGNLRVDLFAFVLKHSEDKGKIKTGEMLELWDDYVEVVESFKLSDERIIASLQCYPGKLDGPLELTDATGRKWVLKCEIKVSGSFATYEKISNDGKRNIFQYLLESIDHESKPSKNDKLKITKEGHAPYSLSLFQEVASIIVEVKEKITDDSDVVWAGYNSPIELRIEIDDHLALLRGGDYNALENIKVHFLPTCTFQEHSISNGWADEYITLSERFDSLYAKIKRNLEG